MSLVNVETAPVKDSEWRRKLEMASKGMALAEDIRSAITIDLVLQPSAKEAIVAAYQYIQDHGLVPRKIFVADILRIVATYYGLSRAEILSYRRRRSIVVPRQIVMYLARDMTALSLPSIARFLGKYDHTTVLHAVRKIEALIEVDPVVADDIAYLREQIYIMPTESF